VSDSTRAGGFFDRIAGSYASRRYGEGADAWRAYFFGERLRHARELLGGTTGTVLDLGSGPGILGDALGARARVVHLDVSPEMLRRAGGDRVLADARSVPLRNGSVRAVAALGLTAYLDGLAPLLAEARRVLEPGGRLLFSVTRRAAPDTLFRALFRNTLGRLGSGASVLRAGLRIRAWSDREVRRALRRAGFRLLETRRHNYTFFPLCYFLRGASLRLGGSLEDTRGPLRRLASDEILLAEKQEAVPRRGRRIRVLRAIARLNVGGPARQAILLSRDLDPRRYESTLVTGRVAPHEGDMLAEARAAGIDPVVCEGLGRDIRALGDLRAFLVLLARMLAERPDVLHTHTAKAGALGRVAGILAGVPVRIHTFHGHVLHGYFGRLGSALARAAELVLARLSTRILAVSPEVAGDLVRRHRVAERRKVAVLPLGLELEPLLGAPAHRGELRAELGLAADAPLVLWIGRLTGIKDPGLFLETVTRVLARVPAARFAVAGGGDLLEATREKAERLGLADYVCFLGWRSDIAQILADADLMLLTSRNEGTPVALIEAAAAGVPAVATRVGGVPSVVRDGETGLLAPYGDAEALAAAAAGLLADPERRRRMGAAARSRAHPYFSGERLVGDIDRLYRLCLARTGREAP
jgi:glycosyltransferase involved in cell wall biosynthesis